MKSLTPTISILSVLLYLSIQSCSVHHMVACPDQRNDYRSNTSHTAFKKVKVKVTDPRNRYKIRFIDLKESDDFSANENELSFNNLEKILEEYDPFAWIESGMKNVGVIHPGIGKDLKTGKEEMLDGFFYQGEQAVPESFEADTGRNDSSMNQNSVYKNDDPELEKKVRRRNSFGAGLAISAMVIGIGGFFILPFITGIVSLIIGSIAAFLFVKNDNKKGIILAGIGMGSGILNIVLSFSVVMLLLLWFLANVFRINWI